MATMSGPKFFTRNFRALLPASRPYARVPAPKRRSSSLALSAAASTSRVNLTSDLHPGYRLRHLRGRGGFGEVWEAESDRDGPVALKFLPCPKGQGPAQELRSIQVVQGLHHEHITRIHR